MPPIRPAEPSPRAGFSLTELLVACAILSVLAAFAMPTLDPTRDRADAGMRLVRTTLQQAQRMAVQHQFDVIVSFDVPGRRMRVAEDSTNDRQIDPGERVRWIPFDESVRFVVPPLPVPNGLGGNAVAGPGARDVAGLPSVTFHRSGAASGVLEVYLEAVRRERRELRAVAVSHSTGRTTWYRLQDEAWKEGDL